MASKRRHIEYKAGQILLGPKRENGDQSKVKIIKCNTVGHYKIGVYYMDAHDIVCRVYTNMHYSFFEKAGLSLKLSGLLKRL